MSATYTITVTDHTGATATYELLISIKSQPSHIPIYKSNFYYVGATVDKSKIQVNPILFNLLQTKESISSFTLQSLAFLNTLNSIDVSVETISHGGGGST